MPLRSPWSATLTKNWSRRPGFRACQLRFSSITTVRFALLTPVFVELKPKRNTKRKSKPCSNRGRHEEIQLEHSLAFPDRSPGRWNGMSKREALAKGDLGGCHHACRPRPHRHRYG